MVVIVGFGLIAWRGDRLRSPGGIDAPLGREGAFLLNNLLFVGFAFVVLLGTLYPLLYEAVTQQQVNVGAPFFNTIAVPFGLSLLFLMAVAPALSWRKINGTILWHRLAIPAWTGVLTVVLCVIFGLRGFAPSGRASASGRSPPPRRRARWCSRSVPRAATTWGGGAGSSGGRTAAWWCTSASSSWPSAIIAATDLPPADRADPAAGTDGAPTTATRFEFVGLSTVVTPSKTSDEALVKVDGGVFTPATTNFGGALATVGTPAIDSGAFGDVYLTFDEVGGLGTTSGGAIVPNLPAGSVVIGVVIEPLVAWLWTGGLLVGLGGLLALAPGSRRRATDPVSAPSAMVTGNGPAPESEPERAENKEEGEEVDERRADLTPVGSGAAVESGAPSA